jgi:hypothetical protein
MANFNRTTKICHGCRRPHPLREFGRDRSRPGGLAAYCRPCINARERDRKGRATPRPVGRPRTIRDDDETDELMHAPVSPANRERVRMERYLDTLALAYANAAART